MKQSLLYGSSLLLTCLLARADHGLQTNAPAIAKKSPDEKFLTHKLLSGETAGGLLNNLNLHPIWGPGGYAEKLVHLNPNVVSPNGSFIQKGKVIKLPVSSLPPAPYYIVDKSGVVYILWDPFDNYTPKSQVASSTNQCEKNPMRSPAQESSLPDHAKDLDSFEMHSLLELTPRLSFLQISSKDNTYSSRATSSTRGLFGVDLGWTQFLTSKLKTLIEFSYTHFSWIPSSPKATNDTPNSKFAGSIGAGYTIAAPVILLTKFTYGEEQFTIGKTSSALGIDSFPQARFSLGSDFRIFRSNVFTSGIEAWGSIILPASPVGYSVKTGFGYKAKGYIEHLLGTDTRKGFRIKASCGFSSDYQSTSSTDQSRSELIFGLGIGKGF